MGAPTKYTKSMCETALEILSRGKSLAAVCSALNITRPTLYEWRDGNAEFKKAIDIGLQKAQEVWEEIGEDGIKGNYEKFGAAPWIFTMKNRFRDDYTEEKESKTISDTIVEKLIDRLVD